MLVPAAAAAAGDLAAGAGMIPCDNPELTGDCSSWEQESAPSSEVASVAPLPPPSRHSGAASWSWIPGVCGACGCPASGWSLLPRGPSWLPSDPQARVHLRLLWSFYTSSLPNSCVAMRGALRVGALSALRAEATLLSLQARGLGFSSLSLSARRLAEICDIHDTGGPNPAWGPQHPLATADGLWRSLADLTKARRHEHSRGFGHATHQVCGNTTVSGSNSSSSDSGASSSSSSRGGSSASERRRPVANRPSTSVARASHGDRAVVANFEITTAPPHLTTTCRSRNGHGMHGNTRCTSEVLPQHCVQQRQRQDHQQQFRGDKQQNHYRERWQRASEQVRRSNTQSFGRQEQMQQQKQQQDAWGRVAALRQEISSSAIRFPGHPVHDALVACLSELHAAKQLLTFLFEDNGKGKNVDNQAAHTTQHSPVPGGRPVHSQSQSRKRSIWSSSAAATSAAATAVAVAATRPAAALGRLASSVCAAVAPRVRQPLSAVRSWLSGVPLRLLHGLEEGAACAAAAALAAAQAAAQRGYSVRLIQNALLLADWIWGPTAWLGICRGETLCLGLSFLWGPSPVQQVLQEAARLAAKRWDFACSLVSRSLLPAAAALHQLQQLHRLLADWRLFGPNRWRDFFAYFSRQANNSGSARSSPWATPEGLRRVASTSTCYWSPPEKPAVSSQEKLLAAPPSVPVLPHQQLLQPQAQHELQQQLLEEQSGQELRNLEQRVQQVRREWQRHSELEKDCDPPWMRTSSHRSRSSAAASNATAAASPGNSTELPALRGSQKGSRRSWTCPPNTNSELNDPLGISLGEATNGALSRKISQENLHSGESTGGAGPDSSLRRLSHAAAATRAAAAGAAAAAATASWGSADVAWPHGPRRPLRHVSFLKEDEAFPSESASGLADWDACTVAAAIKSDTTDSHAAGNASFESAGILPRERSGGHCVDLPTEPFRGTRLEQRKWLDGLAEVTFPDLLHAYLARPNRLVTKCPSFQRIKSFGARLRVVGPSVRLALGSWQAPRFYVYQAGEVPGARKELLYIKESAWGPAAAQVGPAPVFLAKYLELQASPSNTTPLKERKTIELGAGCGLVSMVAALMGAEASACEDDAALPLLQHNAATFNSEFNKCKPECVIAHTWRSQEPEEAFFKALGRSLMVRRVDEQRSIQRKCSQPLNRSIADSARDIWEATDEDGSIDIFSVRPHADISTQTWREELRKLLSQLQEEDAARSVSAPALAKEALTETKELVSKRKGASGSQTAALSVCSTLSGSQGRPLSSVIASGSHTPADEEPPPALSSEESLVDSRVTASALIDPAAPKAPAQVSLLFNSSRPALQQQPLRATQREIPLGAPKSGAGPQGAAPKPPVSPTASRVRPQTSNPSGPATQSQHQQVRQQRLPPSSLIGDRSPVAGAAASSPTRPLRSAAVPRAPGSPPLGSPLNASNAAAQATSPVRATGPASPAPSMKAVRAVLRTAPPAATANPKTAIAKSIAKAAVGSLAKPILVAAKAATPPGLRSAQPRHSLGAVPSSPPAADSCGSSSAASSLKGPPPTPSSLRSSLAQPRQLLTSPALAAPATSSAAPVPAPSAAARPKGTSNLGAGVAPSLSRASGVAAAKAATLSISEKPIRPTISLARPLTSGGGALLSKVVPVASGRPPSAGSPIANTSATGGKASETLERQPSTHITAAGPLGSRFVSRLSNLFKRSHSKELKD
ncbi:hypothetical protein ACSSS7_003254 [Eimeria intestinalis]